MSDTSKAQLGAKLAMAATPTASPTQPNTPTITPIPTPWAFVPAGPVKGRSGPAGSYAVIGEVAQGATLAITGRRDDGAWLRVCCTANGKEAWVPANALKVSGPLEQAEVVKLPTATAAPTKAPRAQPLRQGQMCASRATC